MDDIVVLHANNTHLYPGAQLQADREEPFLAIHTDVVVLFTDHSRAEGAVRRSSDGFVLQVDRYVTDAGSHLAAKTWSLTPHDGIFTISGRLV
ncbi:hypothetical protein [Brachybacterium kimchii]|uniref:DUF4440 domain-containing protein n=1 Tax=Brachybacterium kimchii TaxID=2942909 RepID=A0ABY4N7W1_9MICO|nr:hypothetical protein [Brachybacterium kimchii]UQN30642.1 hypothetical protein M4486_04895 [Brachybacterium kimchii]